MTPSLLGNVRRWPANTSCQYPQGVVRSTEALLQQGGGSMLPMTEKLSINLQLAASPVDCLLSPSQYDLISWLFHWWPHWLTTLWPQLSYTLLCNFINWLYATVWLHQLTVYDVTSSWIILIVNILLEDIFSEKEWTDGKTNDSCSWMSKLQAIKGSVRALSK